MHFFLRLLNSVNACNSVNFRMTTHPIFVRLASWELLRTFSVLHRKPFAESTNPFADTPRTEHWHSTERKQQFTERCNGLPRDLCKLLVFWSVRMLYVVTVCLAPMVHIHIHTYIHTVCPRASHLTYVSVSRAHPWQVQGIYWKSVLSVVFELVHIVSKCRGLSSSASLWRLHLAGCSSVHFREREQIRKNEEIMSSQN